MNQSLDFRRDNRTEEQFAEDIKFRTKKETFLVDLFKKECDYLCISCKVENNGVDNSGKIVKESSCAADYRITVAGKTELYEVKCSPVNSKWTFKVYQLEQYVKQNANILIFYNTGYIDKDPSKIRKETMYGIITPDKIQLMLDSYEHTPNRWFGNKPCVMVFQQDFELFIKPMKLTHFNN